jgi:hypothetical protein
VRGHRTDRQRTGQRRRERVRGHSALHQPQQPVIRRPQRRRSVHSARSHRDHVIALKDRQTPASASQDAAVRRRCERQSAGASSAVDTEGRDSERGASVGPSLSATQAPGGRKDQDRQMHLGKPTPLAAHARTCWRCLRRRCEGPETPHDPAASAPPKRKLPAAHGVPGMFEDC